ncbi:Fe(2+)-trafficking protein [Myxococcota bacterium]|nr:Fe(2+)-trafficking protein [Myxococcota bacterium]MBU1432341.1 Fe(2+)-trafficking protein [Myxococcota bacterium]MBU1898113.1 Fe(2+)-trafficking protein [Myxococcota bacterium]
MDLNARIEQFRKMAQANPEDDLAHYAFGQALCDAERYEEAVHVLRHVIKINPDYTRAYLLLGVARRATSDEDGAVEIWQAGYQRALVRGELMPANEMAGLLRGVGVEPEAPEVEGPRPEDDRPLQEGEIRCHRNQQIGAPMRFKPFESPVGEFIYEKITAESWEAWMDLSVKVINELRLDLGDPRAQAIYDEQMKTFLRLPDALFEP